MEKRVYGKEAVVRGCPGSYIVCVQGVLRGCARLFYAQEHIPIRTGSLVRRDTPVRGSGILGHRQGLHAQTAGHSAQKGQEAAVDRCKKSSITDRSARSGSRWNMLQSMKS